MRHDLAPGSIEWVQAELNKLGYATSAFVVDGLDGTVTERAIRAFQARVGLTDDGIVGPVVAIEKAPA